MRLIDRRLVRHARASRTYLGLAVAIGLGQVAMMVGGAVLLARIVVQVHTYGAGLAATAHLLVPLALTFLARASLAWLAEAVAHQAAANVKSELRMRLLRHVVGLGPRWLAGHRSGELAALSTRGIDALDGYIARYLPQLVLAALLPLAICVQLAVTDWRSALLVVATLPLIPLTFVAVSRLTRRATDDLWGSVQRLAHQFLDALAGVETLAAFGRTGTRAAGIDRVVETNRSAEQRNRRFALLDSLALETVAAFAVGGVVVLAVVRVLSGSLGLEAALIVLILAPEAYRPIRRMATWYHATAEGLGAADRVFAVLDEPLRDRLDLPAIASTPVRAYGRLPDPAVEPIRLNQVTVLAEDRNTPLLDRVSLSIEPGRFTGIVAPTGAGKSTVFGLLLGVIRPDVGRITIGEIDLAGLDPYAWRGRVGWLPQQPVLFGGTVGENIALGHPTAPPIVLQRAADAAAVDVPLDRPVGEHGTGLSVGQCRRVALARALLGSPSLLLLDEPTESVDAETEAVMFDALRRAPTGRTVVIATHRPALLQLCHQVVGLRPFESTGVREEVPA